MGTRLTIPMQLKNPGAKFSSTRRKLEMKTISNVKHAEAPLVPWYHEKYRMKSRFHLGTFVDSYEYRLPTEIIMSVICGDNIGY